MINKYNYNWVFILILVLSPLHAQKKTMDTRFIKTEVPENSIVGIKNDEMIKKTNNIKCEIKLGSSIEDQDRMNSINAHVTQANNFDVIQTTVATENNYFKGHCVVTEQTGTEAGTLWVVAVIESNPIGSDKIGIYRYEQTGWVLKTYVYTFRNISYTLDAEIVESTAGNKALWIATDYTEAVTFKRKVLVIGLNLNNLAEGTIMDLVWPGGSANSYYNPRITTDNGVDGDFPYIYLITSVDSLMINSKHVNGQKFAYIINAASPFTAEAHYRPDFLPVFWPDGGTSEIHTLHSDIAYINQQAQGSKLIFTYSNVPDQTKIWLSSADIAGSNAQFMGTISRGNNNKIINSVISSPGGLNKPQLMVVFEENYNNSGDYDLYSARSNDGGVNWEINQIDLSTSSSVVGKLVNRRGVLDEYYLSYSTGGQSIMSVKSNNNTSYYWDAPVQVNDATPTFNSYNSSVGFTNTVGERLTVWSRFDQPLTMPVLLIGSFFPNLPTGIEDTEIETLKSFDLLQNYPNPFNPTTIIRWHSSISSHQTLKIYDVLGKEIITLIDEEKPSGEYEVNFNAFNLSSGIYFYQLRAGSFVQTKKMLLVK
jgi:hypothetical protein